jgi:hypothetical protein
MKSSISPENDRFEAQRQVIVWVLLAGASFLGANAWFVVHMLGPID